MAGSTDQAITIVRMYMAIEIAVLNVLENDIEMHAQLITLKIHVYLQQYMNLFIVSALQKHLLNKPPVYNLLS